VRVSASLTFTGELQGVILELGAPGAPPGTILPDGQHGFLLQLELSCGTMHLSFFMGVNRDKPDRWKEDIRKSVDLYNRWFMRFAPSAFRAERLKATKWVEDTLNWTRHLRDLSPSVLKQHPGMLPTLRMACCPPIARDRLIGLAAVNPAIVGRMELENRLPVRLSPEVLDAELIKIGRIIQRLADRDIFTWLDSTRAPARADIHRAASIVADRVCGASADPIIRNAQEARQLELIGEWLRRRGYTNLPPGRRVRFSDMAPGTFAFRLNIPVELEGMAKSINIPVDVAIKPLESLPTDLPLLVEAKSAGDFTNVNKRRKEEATKMSQLRHKFGLAVHYILFLCGYFDGGYLGYEASEGIDWVWEHRIDDLAEFGL
jgi:hypothetical protein